MYVFPGEDKCESFYETVCSSFQIVWGEFRTTFQDEFGNDENYEQLKSDVKVRILKRIADDSFSEIMMEMNGDGHLTKIISANIIGLDSEIEKYIGFEGMFVPFPIPFKDGDILTNVVGWGYGLPFVIYDVKSITNYDEELVSVGDGSDMSYQGYYLSQTDNCLVEDKNYTYMNLEYYRKKLTKREVPLIPISNYVKGKINLTLLLAGFMYTMAKRSIETQIPITHWYTAEGMQLAGIEEKN